MNINVDNHRFVEGDAVVLAHGTYQGATGTFLRLNADVNWAGIRERNGTVRSHPVAWLAHTAPLGPPATNSRPPQNMGAE
jgi:hypothetical protein